MAGPIQTAIGRVLGAAGASLAANIMTNEKNARQTAKEEGDKAEKEGKAEKEIKSSEANPYAEALKTAQKNKIDLPKQIFFSDSGTPLATSYEMASVLSNQSLANASASKKRARTKTRERKQALMKRKLVSKS